MTNEEILEELLHKAHQKGIYQNLITEINNNHPGELVDLKIWEKYYLELKEKSKISY